MMNKFDRDDVIDAASEALLFAQDGIAAAVIIGSDGELEVVPASDILLTLKPSTQPSLETDEVAILINTFANMRASDL